MGGAIVCLRGPRTARHAGRNGRNRHRGIYEAQLLQSQSARRSRSRWHSLVPLGVVTAQESPESSPRQPGARVESDLHRDADCDEIRRTRPVSGSARSFTRQSLTRTTGSIGATRRYSSKVGPRTERRAGQPSSLPRTRRWSASSRSRKRRWTRDMRRRSPMLERRVRAQRTLARTTERCARRASSAASAGESRSRTPCSPGAPPMGSARAIHRSREAQRSASGGPIPPATAMSAQGLAFTDLFVLVSNTQFRPEPPRGLGQQHVHGRFQCGHVTGSTRPDRRVLKTRRRSRRSGRGTPASTGIRRRTRLRVPTTCRCQDSNRLLAVLERRHGRHRIHVWSASDSTARHAGGSDVAAGDLNSARRDRRQSGRLLPIRAGCRS